jgi:exopolysaccharide biosynthesis polyprenyl glycosylphosphotransferase
MNDKRRVIIQLLKLFDLTMIACAFALTTIEIVKLEYNMSLAQFLALRTRVANLGIVILVLFTCQLILQVCGLYRSHRLALRRREVIGVLKATTLITTCLVGFGSLFSIQMLTNKCLVIFWAMSTVLLCTGRATLRLVAARLRSHGKDLRYMLILGSNPRAVAFARMLADHPEHGYRLLGFVDEEWLGIPAARDTGIPIVSDFAGLAEFLRRNVVDEVAVYLPFGSFYRHSSEVANLCQQHGITIRLDRDILGVKGARWQADAFEDHLYITTDANSSNIWPLIIKRTLDVAVSTVALVVLSPVLVAAAIGIKLTSSGPMFFQQERIGLNKRRFKVFKFRTMVPNAEKLMADLEKHNEASGPVFKIKNDPRITPIGRFLRKSSIDELPQLLNVLSGDMSLVGPRPLPVRDFEGFNDDWQRRRFSVRPGITCLWQVNGRSSVSFEQWMLLDIKYLDEWSLWLDLTILARTIPAVFKGVGAT